MTLSFRFAWSSWLFAWPWPWTGDHVRGSCFNGSHSSWLSWIDPRQDQRRCACARRCHVIAHPLPVLSLFFFQHFLCKHIFLICVHSFNVCRQISCTCKHVAKQWKLTIGGLLFWRQISLVREFSKFENPCFNRSASNLDGNWRNNKRRENAKKK